MKAYRDHNNYFIITVNYPNKYKNYKNIFQKITQKADFIILNDNNIWTMSQFKIVGVKSNVADRQHQYIYGAVG